MTRLRETSASLRVLVMASEDLGFLGFLLRNGNLTLTTDESLVLKDFLLDASSCCASALRFALASSASQNLTNE